MDRDMQPSARPEPGRVSGMTPMAPRAQDPPIMADGVNAAQRMSFTVCGMPRGGTTFFGQLFNVHEDVFCYFMETSLFRQLALFGRDRPFPAENLPLLEQWLRSELWHSLVEGTDEGRVRKFRRLVRYRELLDQHGLTEASGPGIRVWNEQAFEVLLRDLLELFGRGLYGEALFAEGLALLQRHFGAVTSRRQLGEKTPDNVFFLDLLHAADPDLKVFCILREPYSTIESMKRRALRNEAFGDSAFSKEAFGGIADYYRFMVAAYEYSKRADPGSFHACRFEDLVRDPAAVMERAYAQLGLGMTDAARQILPQLSIPTDKRHTQDLQLTPAEHRLIEVTLGPMLRHFGYPGAHAHADAGDADFGEGILPLAGVHMDTGDSNGIVDAWMARRADLLLIYGPKRRKLVLDMGCNFPEAVGAGEVVLSFVSGEREIRSVALSPVTPVFTVEVPLDELASMPANATMSAARLVISSSVSYVPFTVAGAGNDLRDISFLVRACRLE